ncbi:ABC transporter ATP-binding protein [Patescibacteria group bacterium]|nr:ABC transporter ATP-binding protein [Patescibacteria group bacterium]MCL5091912.1 ABC transporter ATP-binding protein [Patescibacteria group bacterium]
MDIIQVDHLTKRFRDVTAVNDVSFSLHEGEILGLLGPNGAGKTTTIQMLLGVLTPTAGAIRYFGRDLVKERQVILEQVNFSSTYTKLPWRLSVRENLTFISYLYQIKNRKKRIGELVKIFKIEKLIDQPMTELSAGQLTRVNLAKAFINYPKVLLLDEPTASLDPDVADYIRQFLLEERRKFKVSIIITSHNMAEVEEVCDRVIFINQGRLIADDTPEGLAKTIEISHVELLVKDGLKRLVEYCRSHDLGHRLAGRYITIDIKEHQIAAVLRQLADKGIYYDEISINKPSLEDYFLQMTKKNP